MINANVGMMLTDINHNNDIRNFELDAFPPLKDKPPDELDSSGNGDEARWSKCVNWRSIDKGLKIIVPHVGLTFFLLVYITFGAGVLMWLENDIELQGRLEKFDRVHELYETVYRRALDFCQNTTEYKSDAQNVYGKIKYKLAPFLINLSMLHEHDERFTDDNQPWKAARNNVQRRWTFVAAFIYCLTVISTTGYDHISPVTDIGRIFAVFFGLVGIPIMFITAANIGKFLSEIVTKSYIYCIRFKRCLQNRIHRIKKISSESIIDGVNDDFIKIKLPVFAYFFMILLYCAVGGICFSSYERGASWTFVTGLFFSFNTITTIGLGNVIVDNAMYMFFIVGYCIVGLAIITMCVDLASAQLKILFTKLHYFGRTFRGARSTFMNMSDDIKETIRLIAALKHHRSSKGPVTLEDLKCF